MTSTITRSDGTEVELTQRLGRKVAIEIIDIILSDGGNIHMLYSAMEDLFNEDPVAFFKDVVMPLTPKQHRVESDVVSKVKLIRAPITMPEESDGFVVDRSRSE